MRVTGGREIRESRVMIIFSRSTSPWTEIEDRVETLPWEKRNFPLSEEELKDLEVNI